MAGYPVLKGLQEVIHNLTHTFPVDEINVIEADLALSAEQFLCCLLDYIDVKALTKPTATTISSSGKMGDMNELSEMERYVVVLVMLSYLGRSVV